AAKRGLGADAPVHLFGAGHPMMFALGVVMGCDLFDSAAYALYARDDRYLTVRGTRQLADLEYLPCSCPVCTSHSPDDLRSLSDRDREEELAAHNLHVTFAEIRRIKQAIRAGNLLELVEQRARAHPTMLDGYRTLLDHAAQLEQVDPVSKGAFFYTSHESARRPEVLRHHRRLARLETPDSLFLTEGEPVRGDDFDCSWRVEPPFGPFPRALSKSYPLTAEVPARTDRAALEAAAEGVCRLVETNPETDVALGHRGWPSEVLARLPDGVELIDLTAA
ncbi:tRNA-guanine transglycosylase, partial [Natronobacterium gregoryi]